MELVKKTETCVTREYVVELDDTTIRALVERELGVTLPIGREVEITVQVPGGGDWSNIELEINYTTPVRVRWITIETETV